MLKAIIPILVIFYCALCQAQCDTIIRTPDHHINLKLSYNSSLIYPGISAGIEYPVNPFIKSGFLRQHKNKSVIIERFISGNLNWYHHPGFHDNLYLTAEWVMRRTSMRGFISDFSFGPGYSRTFLGGTTYKVNDYGDISVIKLAGYNYALITIGGGLGYDFSTKKQLPFSALARMNLLSMFPYNSTIYLRPVMEFGIRYTPGRIKNK